MKGSSPVVTDAGTTTEAPMTKATFLPVDDEPVPTPAVEDEESLFAFKSQATEDKMVDQKLDALETPSSPAPSKEDVTLGNKEEDGIKR